MKFQDLIYLLEVSKKDVMRGLKQTAIDRDKRDKEIKLAAAQALFLVLNNSDYDEEFDTIQDVIAGIPSQAIREDIHDYFKHFTDEDLDAVMNLLMTKVPEVFVNSGLSKDSRAEELAAML